MNNFLSKLFGKGKVKEEKIEYITGEDKYLEKVSLADFKEYPIWLFSSKNNIEEHDDICWLVPLTNSTNVSKDLEVAYILMRIEENGYPVMGMLDLVRMTLDDLWYCTEEDDTWRMLREVDLPNPICLVAVPTIMNQEAMKFTVLDNKEFARKSKEKKKSFFSRQ